MSSPSSAEPSPLPAPASLAIHLDLVGGISGDMFVAALADALPALEALVLAELAAVRPVGAGTAEFHDAASGGLQARRFGLAGAAGHAGVGGVAGDRSGGTGLHGNGDAHGGTSHASLRRQLDAAALTAPTRTHALALLALLAEAEARVHGIAIDAVHFHELADWDSLLDLVAAGCIAGALDGAQWSASAPPLGGGTVHTAHGVLPVPTPATVQLLTGYPWREDGIGSERVTPTGAAILRHLVPVTACAAHRDGGRLRAVGCGAGTRELAGMPNILRALVFDRTPTPGGDVVAIVEFDVDDMTGEEIAAAADRLRAEHGVIDVSFGNRVGKKARPVVDFRLLVAPHATEAVVHACFVETSTLGLRVREERRRLVARADAMVAVGAGPLQVKLARRPDGTRTAKAAHDDVASAPGLAARREMRAAGERRAMQDDDT